jgi:NAD(P)-dependent dehydrogenase (short-subunit alcohol dehydrogenase family)
MKHCLITGGGSKFGLVLTECFLLAGYTVHLVTSSDVSIQSPNLNIIKVDWNTLSLNDLKLITSTVPNLDLIFFNHNASSLSINNFKLAQIQSPKHWQQSYFVTSQFPFYLIHALYKKLNKQAKIGWMLSQLISHPEDQEIGFANYIGNKFTNACIMRAFAISDQGCFFGICPEFLLASDAAKDLEIANNIVSLVDNLTPDQLNGRIFSTDGDELIL